MYGWVTLGAARPQTCGKGFHPLHPNRRKNKQGREGKHRQSTRGLRKFEGFWPKKAGKIPGESSLSPEDYFQAFPGCEASGKAASPPGQKHKVIKPDFVGSSRLQREPGRGHPFNFLPLLWVQGPQAPGGARGNAPPFLCVSDLKCPSYHD